MRQILGIGRKHRRLFELSHLLIPHTSSTVALIASSVASTYAMSSFHLGHCRLGHVSFSRLKTLVSSG